MVMGCYGIGVGRTAAAAIEQNHDERGIRWPVALAPFEVAVLALNPAPAVFAAAETIHDKFVRAGVDVIFDDRSERAGVKFTDAELIGFPFVVVVGSKGLEAGEVELKDRRTGATEKAPFDAVVQVLAQRIFEARCL